MSTINETYSMDDQIIGASYMILCVISIIIYIPCLIVMRYDEELKDHSCLRIMFHMGISDILNLTGLAICGLFSLTGYAYTVPLWLNGLLMNVIFGLSWYSYIIFLNVLSLNRCVTFNCNGLWNERLFGENATTKWIMLCWLWAVCWMAFYMSPWGGYIYYAKDWVYFYDFKTPYVNQLSLASLINCIIQISCIWLWCTLALVGFKKEFGDMTGKSESYRSKERSLLIQSVVICAVLFTMDQYWHNIHSNVCPSSFLYCGVIGQYLLILNGSINPILYLTANKTIKTKVLELIGLKKVGIETAVVIQL